MLVTRLILLAVLALIYPAFADHYDQSIRKPSNPDPKHVETVIQFHKDGRVSVDGTKYEMRTATFAKPANIRGFCILRCGASKLKV